MDQQGYQALRVDLQVFRTLVVLLFQVHGLRVILLLLEVQRDAHSIGGTACGAAVQQEAVRHDCFVAFSLKVEARENN